MPKVRPLQGDQHAKSSDEMAAEEALLRDAQPLVTRCALCRWRHTGTAGNGRERALQHRKEKHPELLGKKRKLGKSLSLKAPSVEARAQARANQDAARKAKR